MSTLHCDLPSSLPQKRRHRRFGLQYPVCVKVGCADSMYELEAVSRNISVGGVLLETAYPIPQNTAVSFIVTVRSAQAVRPIQFLGEGKVIRVDANRAESAFAIAVECKQPITQLDANLAPAGS